MMYTDKQIKLAYKNGLLEEVRNNMIEAEIAKKYSIGTQIAILRQANTKPSEYEEFTAYAEQCKVSVKEKIAAILSVDVNEVNRLT